MQDADYQYERYVSIDLSIAVCNHVDVPLEIVFEAPQELFIVDTSSNFSTSIDNCEVKPSNVVAVKDKNGLALDSYTGDG